MNTTAAALQPNVIVTGPMLPEPVQVIVTVPLGASIKLIGKGLRTGQIHEPILSPDQMATLPATKGTEDPQTAIEVRFIEVKGRAGVGEVALSSNEYRTAERLGRDYWLYAVCNCGGTPEVHTIQDPARLGWEAVMAVEHYRIGVVELVRAAH